MPQLSTDDGPRRLRGVWLGPKGLRWPVDWTYTQWGVFFALMVVCPPMIFAVFYFLNVYLAACNAILWSPFLAYWLTRRIMAHTDYDRPLRFWVRQLLAEWRRSRPTPGAGRILVNLSTVAVHPIAPAVMSEYFTMPVQRRKEGGVDAHPSTGQPGAPVHGRASR